MTFGVSFSTEIRDERKTDQENKQSKISTYEKPSTRHKAAKNLVDKNFVLFPKTGNETQSYLHIRP